MKVDIDPTIFRDYDIRGIYPKQINEKVFYILGQAITSYLKATEIAVGYDARLSSPSLSQAFVKGVVSQGVNVFDLGQISTEMHYFASGFYNFDANVVISASHNPPEYNGLKVVKKGVVPLHGENGLPEIKELAINQNFSEGKKMGQPRKLDIVNDWTNHVLSFINPSKLKKLKVVIDAGNGMGGISWEKLKDRLPVSIIPLYFKPDGNFPHHLPDPLNEKNLKDIKKKIINLKADCGFALDGDADRLFVLDEKAQVISGTVTTAILASHLLKKDTTHLYKSTIIYNVVCGRIVPETIKRFNANPVRVRVGHSFIKEYMKREKALFAGEHSGHFYFRDNYNADSSTIASLLFLEFVSGKIGQLSEIVSKINIFPSSGEINFEVSQPKRILSHVESFYPDADSIDNIDGLSVWYHTFWFNLRSSKTEPYVRLNLEADNKKILNVQLDRIINIVKSLGGTRV